jgi:hypothetical protein
MLDRIEALNAETPVKVVFSRDSLMNFADSHYRQHERTKSTWNGRQIRNAFQTAIALGRHDRLKRLKKKGMSEEEAERTGKRKLMTVELTRENFLKIARMDKDFEDYLFNVRGSDIMAARDESVRNDEYNPLALPIKKDYSALLGTGVPSARKNKLANIPSSPVAAIIDTPATPGPVADGSDTGQEQEKPTKGGLENLTNGKTVKNLNSSDGDKAADADESSSSDSDM